MTQELTERQKQVYRFMVEHLRENHNLPNMSEVSQHFQISLNAAICHKDALLKKGWVVNIPGRAKYKLGRGSVSVRTPCTQ
jgi:predicted transcriptional regulator